MNQIQSITGRRWFDRHLHVRDGKMLETVLPCTLGQQATGAVIMGNLPSPNHTSTIEKTIAYRERISRHLPSNSDFKLCMTCYLTDEITPEEVVRGYKEGVWIGVKGYLANQKGEGGTTHSSQGVKNFQGRYPVFAAMEKHGIPYLGHFEAVEEEVDEFDREVVSLDRDLEPLHRHFPGLKIVVEHVTDGRMADFVAEADGDVYATATPQGIMLNRNAMFWGGMNPDQYCKPVPKKEKHRLRVRKYVTSGNKKFGAGTDSAPHSEFPDPENAQATAKACSHGCSAGIFSAPDAVELYATAFDEDNALPHLFPFLSENFLHVYGMEVSKEEMTIERTPYEVPKKIGPVLVFKGGTTLPFKLVKV